jgi:hypothetical protein
MVRMLVALALYLVATTVSAQLQIGSPVSSVSIEPATPAAGQLVRIVLQFESCAFPTPGTNSVTVSGSTITFSQLVVPPICGVPPPQPPVSFDLGAFQPGSYTLVYAPSTGSQGFAWVPSTPLGFTVGAASIPTLWPAGIAALLFAMLVVAWRFRRLAVSATRSRR